MSKQSIAIINANVVNEGSIKQVDVLLESGRIKQVDSNITLDSKTEIVDAKGMHLLPGLIDDQVHFREPGLTHKGGIFSESAAAIAGGVTSFMDMPNVNPPTITRDLLSQKYKLAEGKAHANYAFYLGATNNNVEEIKRLQTGEACGVKVFMGASTGNMLVDNDDALEKIFSECPILIATHCEDTPSINKNLEAKREQYKGSEIPVSEHPNIRSVETCYKSSSKAVGLAKKFGTKLHVLHLTTKKELGLFDSKNHREKNITAEVCVHHLHFNDSSYDDLQQLIVCNPAIKTENDQRALMEAVNGDLLDIIATDHAPHTIEEKSRPYPDCPSGLPLVQHSLLLCWIFFIKEKCLWKPSLQKQATMLQRFMA